MDAAAYGTSATMDIFSSIYKHQYLSGNHNMLPIGHSIIPHYLKYIGLDMDKRTEISQYLINKIKKWFQNWKQKRKLKKKLKELKKRDPFIYK